jgi:hypothetical protein
MMEFLESYGLWIALGGVFAAMHWFGAGCCGGHRHAKRETGDTPDVVADRNAPGADRRSDGSCH